MVGCTSANFHEGHRSEYLAQYVFASLGTCVAVPTPEDTGLDLLCTLTERVGQRIWPRASFSVQVKSNTDPWKFESRESVKWLVQHPAPIFLSIVLKKEGRIRIYQTLPRYYFWLYPPIPESCEVIPGDGTRGQITQWKDGKSFSLSAPIHEFEIEETMEEGFVGKSQEILRTWIDFDLENRRYFANRIPGFAVPSGYTTGSTSFPGKSYEWLNAANDEQVSEAISGLREQLDWVAWQCYQKGDWKRASRAMLLLRELFRHDSRSPRSLSILPMEKLSLLLNGCSPSYVCEPIDSLGELLDARLNERSP